ncbi:DDE-type integrase/transposase/recombinase [Algiphilus sp. W345]|uniref:DDE-type integrase/transposase/recombinase n=1 Tax=Banduia mediterranea TaxID=3075609 RepID=A0ABU2WF40_9GAMM|nr:DDE-type integrase/transposase/recombinase [Algiphilus sp. W345]MDT0496488.1 DDE-type integrase/transposase/recombinase [Algiphilus sp. W345]
MKAWFTAAELAGLPAMPATKSGTIRFLERAGLSWRKRAGRGGGREYSLDALPAETRKALASREMQRNRSTQRAASAGAEAGIALRQAHTTNRDRSGSLQAQIGFTGWKAQRFEPRAELYVAIDVYRRAAACNWRDAIAAYNAGQIPVSEAVKRQFESMPYKTFEKWIARVREHGLAGLAPKYGNRRGTGAIDSQPELQEFLIGLLAEYGANGITHAPKAARAHFRARPDIVIPSVTRIREWAKAYSRNNASALTSVTNPDAWKNKYMAAPGKMDEFIKAINQCWELDSTPSDVTCHDGRYALIGCIDVWPRRMKILVSRTSTAEAIGQLFRRCVLDWGVPQEVHTDGGKDYVSNYFLRVLADLQIEHRECTPFSPWEKPFIERGLGTFLHSPMIELHPAFIGHDVAEAQELRARQTFAERLFKKNATVTVDLTGAELQKLCDEYCAWYENQPHSSLGCTPAEKARSWQGTVRRIENERALDLLLRQAPSNDGWRTITKSGISIDTDDYWDEAMRYRVGEKVHCRFDEQDMGNVVVYRANPESGALEFLCVARNPGLAGITYAQFAAERRRMVDNELATKRAELQAAARKVKKANVIGSILEQGREARQHIVDFPHRGDAYTTPALEAAAQAARGPQAPEAVIDDRTREILHQMERKPADVVPLRKPKATNTEDDVQARFARAAELERRIAAGETVDPAAAGWLGRYQTTAEYRGHKRFVESFGLQL